MEDVIKEKVIKKLKGKVWTFAEISQVSVLVDVIQEDLYDDLTAKEKLDLVWDKEIDRDGRTFAEFFKENVNFKLSQYIADVIKDKLEDAKINFNEVDNNEISKGSVGGKSHKERSTDEKSKDKQ